METIYLHGFASSPDSAKARYLQALWGDRPLKIPDLNAGDFQGLTISRQIQQVAALLPAASAPAAIVGSSLGGLTAAFLAQQYSQIERILLLAPAFGFLEHWLPILGDEQLGQWQQTGLLPVYHHGAGKHLPIGYQFLEDARRYDEEQLQRPVPTLILHGRHDETIPITASRTYAASRPWVTLRELDSDHALADALPEVGDAAREFFGF